MNIIKLKTKGFEDHSLFFDVEKISRSTITEHGASVSRLGALTLGDIDATLDKPARSLEADKTAKHSLHRTIYNQYCSCTQNKPFCTVLLLTVWSVFRGDCGNCSKAFISTSKASGGAGQLGLSLKTRRCPILSLPRVAPQLPVSVLKCSCVCGYVFAVARALSPQWIPCSRVRSQY